MLEGFLCDQMTSLWLKDMEVKFSAFNQVQAVIHTRRQHLYWLLRTFKVVNLTCTELMTAKSCSVAGATFLIFRTAQFICSGRPWNCLPFKAFMAVSASISFLIFMKPYPREIIFSVRIILASIFLLLDPGVMPENWLKRASMSSSLMNIDKFPKNREIVWLLPPLLVLGSGGGDFSIFRWRSCQCARHADRGWRTKSQLWASLVKIRDSSECSRQCYRISCAICLIRNISVGLYATGRVAPSGTTSSNNLSWTREIWDEWAEDIHRGSLHRCNDTSLLVNRYHR